jgi:hypothetical protein
MDQDGENLMLPEEILQQLAETAESIRSLAGGLSNEQARWKPAPDCWSVLEVINHLYDEEREDFRAHVDHLLQRAGQPWPEIHPQAWVKERGYNQRDLQPLLAGFIEERTRSLDWLKSLDAPAWEKYQEFEWGRLTAGDVFVSWAAHDLLHLRQLVELRWGSTLQNAPPYDVRYAGEW